jgi:hypothetical protein
MKKKLVLLGLPILIISISLSGCLNDGEEQSSEDERLYGLWYNEETIEDVTYRVVYEFFTNSSFFSGVWDSSFGDYTNSIWGTFKIKNEKLYFNVKGQDPSESVHKYSISDNGNILNLYYEDGINFDILTKFVVE